jgi:hypothetical protein
MLKKVKNMLLEVKVKLLEKEKAKKEKQKKEKAKKENKQLKNKFIFVV